MESTAWATCEDLWDRLRWARLNSPSQMSTEDAGRVIGVPAQTYRTYERRPGTPGARGISPQNAIQLGRRWKISWQWIISGEGTPFDKELSDAQLRLAAAYEAASPELRQAVERILTGTDG